MIQTWATSLGLTPTPLFAAEAPQHGEHQLLLDGVNGSFGVSSVEDLEFEANAPSWAWSSGVLHHVLIARDEVMLFRWDKAERPKYTLRSVDERLERFYQLIATEEPSISVSVTKHAIDTFRRLRSRFPGLAEQFALPAFLLLFSGMLDCKHGDEITATSNQLIQKYDLQAEASELVQKLSPEEINHFIQGFRTPTSFGGRRLETLPSLLVRHAGVTVFQEAHFELVRPAESDLFGVHGQASVHATTSCGVHFTPPGLARSLVEQSLAALDIDQRASLTILDPACGSGSFLHEVLRSLHNKGFEGEIHLAGFDTSAAAVQMARFSVAASAVDWPNLDIRSVRIVNADALEVEWPAADLILMNPPFISLRLLSQFQKGQISKILGKFAHGRPDLSMAFVQKAVDHLNDKGVIGTLLPSGVLSMSYAEGWRRALLDQVSVVLLGVLGEHGLFRYATVQVGSLILKKGGQNDKFTSLWVGEKRNSVSTALRNLRRWGGQNDASSDANETWSLRAEPTHKLASMSSWRPRPGAVEETLNRIRAATQSTVADIFDVKQGALPAPRSAFIVEKSDVEALPANETRWFRKVLENKNIRNGRLFEGKYIFFPKTAGLPTLEDENQFVAELPTFSNHLKHFRDELSRRRGKQNKWWELGEDRKWLREATPKIVTAYFGRKGSFAFDSEGIGVVVQGYGWLPRWRVKNIPEGLDGVSLFRAYIAILNSETFDALASELCPTVGGGQLNLSRRFVNDIPMPNLLDLGAPSSGLGSIVTELAEIGLRIEENGLTSVFPGRHEKLVRTVYGIS